MSDAWKHLGTVVRARRKQLGLTQPEIAERGGPSAALVRQVENGHYDANMQPSMRRGYERALGWTVGSFDRVLAWAEPSTLEDEAPAAGEIQPVDSAFHAQVQFERAISQLIQAETELNASMREIARTELEAELGRPPSAAEIGEWVAWSAAHDARDRTRLEMALIEWVFEDDHDPRSGSTYADIDSFRERVQRLAPRRESEIEPRLQRSRSDFDKAANDTDELQQRPGDGEDEG